MIKQQLKNTRQARDFLPTLRFRKHSLEASQLAAGHFPQRVGLEAWLAPDTVYLDSPQVLFHKGLQGLVALSDCLALRVLRDSGVITQKMGERDDPNRGVGRLAQC